MVSLLLLGVLVIGGVIWFTHHRADIDVGRDRDLAALRRWLQTFAMLATLGAAANGMSRLLAVGLTRDVLAARRSEQVALGLALVVVAVPVGVLLWRRAVRVLLAEPDERAQPAWGWYLVVASTTSLIVAVVRLVRVGDLLAGLPGTEAEPLAAVLVSVPVWFAHQWLLAHPRLGATSTVPRVGVLAGSLVGLVPLAVGVGGLLRVGLGGLYELTLSPPVIASGPDELLGHSIALTVVAAPVWWWYWLDQASHGPRDLLWHVYVLPVAVLGGLAAALVGMGRVLWLGLAWALSVAPAGLPAWAAPQAAAHFAGLPLALAAALVGLAVWGHHRVVLTAEPHGLTRDEPERAATYLASTLGLGTVAVGTVMLVAAALTAAASSALAATGERSIVVTGLSLLLVGVPVWWVFWHRSQVRAHTEIAAERRSPSRRITLLLLSVVPGALALGSLVMVVFVVFRDVIEGVLDLGVLHELRIAVGLSLVAAAIAAYHVAVRHDDRRHHGEGADRGETAAPDTAVHPHHVLLLSPDGAQLAAEVAADTGARVQSLHRLDTPHLEVDAHRIAEEILQVHHPRVVVTVDPDGVVRVIPYGPA